MTSSNFYPSQNLGGSLSTGTEHSYTTGPVYIPPQPAPPRRLPDERDDPRRAYQGRYESPPPGRGYPPRPGQDRYDRPYEESHDEDRRRRRPMPRERESGGRWERPPPPRRPGSRSRSRSPPSRGSDPRINSPASKTQSIPTFTSTVAPTPKSLPPAPIPTRPIETYQSRAAAAPSMVPPVMGLGHMQSTSTTGVGLDSFDLSTFDTTSATHWMGLGAAFKVTHGKDGTQEELVSTFMAMKNGFPLPSFSNGAPVNAMRNTWQEKPVYHTPQSAYMQPPQQSFPAHRINAWETREQDDMKRGNRQVGHGSYDGMGTGHLHSGRWQSDAVVLAGDDD